jgi:hypothetical protein
MSKTGRNTSYHAKLDDMHGMMAMLGMIPQPPGLHRVLNSSPFLRQPYPPSTTSLDELTPIHISELRAGTHHRGNYLLVRSTTATSTNTTIATTTSVEDEVKAKISLHFYSQSDDPNRAVIFGHQRTIPQQYHCW